ncbi:Integral membrane protein SYS [Parasponia andersonii]|uniref:Protein SYS1 homolog n=1 Tax=Parasponia andersonii TaxID=3476 RepID=A0A2P5AHK7_PARAD|nr:Integral membrane protein SYS [Parasponia andersonii]
MFYGAVVWDPWLIVAQIFCLQCVYYLTLGLFLSILVGSRVSRMSLVYFFDYATLTASTVTGWCVIASFLLSALAGVGYLVFLIERAKKCLDFSVTLFIIHLFICIVYGGWPSSVTWWIVNGTGIAIMALLGEYLCIRREMREIPITRLRSSKDLVLHMLCQTTMSCL